MKRILHTPPFTEPDTRPQPVELHPCILPRRRFVLRFLACCAGLTVAGTVIAINRFESPETALVRLLQSVLFPVSMLPWMVPMYLPLLLRVQTKRASLLQLIGLALPLLVAVVSCSLCWGDSSESLVYSMSVVWLALGGTLFFLLPGYLLHLLLSLLKSRTTLREPKD
jgi:hypothetical protein